MTTKLIIRWDGTAPGLQDHVLSLSAWLEPLRVLLAATRRAASNLDVSRPGNLDRGGRGGRLTPAAAAIDLQLTMVRDGSLILGFACTRIPAAGQQEIFRDLPARALALVVRDIRAEASGQARNAVVRKFLRALPAGVETQEYTVEHDGVVLVSEKIASSVVAPGRRMVSGLERLEGHIIGVGFGPGRPTVTFRTSEHPRVTRPATEALVQQALDLRGERVTAMCLAGPVQRVLRLRPSSEPVVVPGPQERSLAIRTQWSRTLEILSR